MEREHHAREAPHNKHIWIESKSTFQAVTKTQVVTLRAGVFQVSLVVKNLPANAGDLRDTGLITGLGLFPGGVHGNPLHYSCLENPRGQRSLVGYSPWGRKESDVTGATQHTRILRAMDVKRNQTVLLMGFLIQHF